MDQSTSLPTYDVRVAWADQIPGLFTVGYSRLDGPDVLGPPWPEHTFTGTYDDLSRRVKRFSYQRGRSSDLTEVVATQGSAEIVDDDEVYNPHNQDSPLAGQLLPLRPYRIRATGPRLVPMTMNGWQVDDVTRARTLNRDDFEQAVMRKRPLAYWRLTEIEGSLEYLNTANDPDAHAYPQGTPLARADPLISGDPGYSQVFGSASRLTVNHTDAVDPRASMTLLALFTPAAIPSPPQFPAPPPPERYIFHKPKQWSLRLDQTQRLTFEYLGTDDFLVTAKSTSSLLSDARYFAVVSWDGKTVRMWLNGAEVEVSA